jgi:hypothetical protein
MQSSPVSSQFFPLRFEYLPQHLVLIHPQSVCSSLSIPDQVIETVLLNSGRVNGNKMATFHDGNEQ